MQSIAVVNTEFPSIESSILYDSGESLLDYDIIVFDPEFPYERRIEFTGGGSCIDIEGATSLQASIKHWSGELLTALKAGKTIFFLLNDYKVDSAAQSSTVSKGVRNYSTSNINNYQVLPVRINVRNAKGKSLKVKDPLFKGLYDVLKDIGGYKVVFETDVDNPIFTTNDGSCVVASRVEFKELPGRLIFLPYFDLGSMHEYNAKTKKDKWTKEGMRLSHAIVAQLISIDKNLKFNTSGTPAPQWLENIEQPKKINEVDIEIKEIQEEIEKLYEKEKGLEESKKLLNQYSALLYETGTPLEKVIEKSLELLGYEVQNYREGDLEIDHVIVSPEGFRMIGESEGKDNSAISITKFRQLETNINEDFERDEISAPAKGVIFGNGYRLTSPDEREEQFTDKCLTNAKRLKTALVRTSDLYNVVLYIHNNPKDESFKKACRNTLESTEGEVVVFPSPSDIPLK